MTIWRGVALIPVADDIEAAVALQERLARVHGTALEPALGPTGNLPHVTIYQGPMADTTDSAKILAEIKQEAGLDAPVHTDATSIYHQPVGWIFLGLRTNDRLRQLQDVTMAAVRQHIDHDAVDLSKDESEYTELERLSYREHGYRYIGSAFKPHITLGHTDEVAAREIAAAGAEAAGERAWTFDRITFYVMGAAGAHSSIVAEESLARP